MTSSQMTRQILSASEVRSAIFDLADDYSWETIAKEMIAQMSGDDARKFLDDFICSYEGYDPKDT